MARTKASQMARKFENVEDSSGSSEESSGQDFDMVEVNEEKEEHEQQEMEAGETGRKSRKRKSKKEKENKNGRGKGSKVAPSHEELLDRLARKREADRLGAQRRKLEKQEGWDGMIALLEDLQAQLRTAKCLTPAIDQYYSSHGLEGLVTEQAKTAVLKWVSRDKSKGITDKSKGIMDKSKGLDKSKAIVDKSKQLSAPRTVQDRGVLTASQQSLPPLPAQQLSSLPPVSTPSSKPHFRTSTPVRKLSLKPPLNTPTSRPLGSSSSSSSSKLLVIPSTSSMSPLSSGADETPPSPPPPEIEDSGLNTSTAFSVDGSSMSF